LNLNPYIEELLDKLKEILEPVGWVCQMDTYFEYKPRSFPDNNGNMTFPESCLVFQPDLLYYKENGKFVCKIWFKFDTSEFDNTSKESLEKLFSVLKPFQDQDYIGDNYWISPEYTDGYWNNHVLD